MGGGHHAHANRCHDAHLHDDYFDGAHDDENDDTGDDGDDGYDHDDVNDNGGNIGDDDNDGFGFKPRDEVCSGPDSLKSLKAEHSKENRES